MQNLENALSENDYQPLQDLYIGGTYHDYYRAKKSSDNPEFGTHFYYRGLKAACNSSSSYMELESPIY